MAFLYSWNARSPPVPNADYKHLDDGRIIMSTVIRAKISEKSAWYLPKHRYYELKHFCLQFPEWKREYLTIDGFSGREHTEYVKSSGIGNPTESQAFKWLYLRERMEMVEKASVLAANDLSDLMLKAVTEGISYDHINPPCCKEVWYAMYRRFFWFLDKARK